MNRHIAEPGDAGGLVGGVLIEMNKLPPYHILMKVD